MSLNCALDSEYIQWFYQMPNKYQFNGIYCLKTCRFRVIKSKMEKKRIPGVRQEYWKELARKCHGNEQQDFQLEQH